LAVSFATTHFTGKKKKRKEEKSKEAKSKTAKQAQQKKTHTRGFLFLVLKMPWFA
jgi:hypothetical protein